MRSVLVTGGAGFIGSNFVRHLCNIEPDIQIINLDALTYAGNPANLSGLPRSPRYEFIQGDICDAALVNDVFQRFQIDTVVHFAAETHVDRSILGPAQFIQSNIIGTFTLLEAARQAWLVDQTAALEQVRFQHVSTDEVFGSLGTDDPPFSETTPYAPNSPYSASKASSDHLVRAYYHTYGLPVTITNCSNNYGPYQFPEKLIPLIILNAIAGKPLPVYGDGQQIRDWLYVEDHCDAIWQVVCRGKLGETYNIGGDNQPANLTIVRTICSILDELAPAENGQPHHALIQFVKDRPGHDRRYAMDIRKIGRDLGWKPKQSLRSGLQMTVEWYLNHPEWVESVKNRGDYSGWMEKNYTNRGEKK
ncbi:MAG: dTDP-glucose 4,6-dehydratase [Anaerolineaceae bacterium]|nr:dTDP-glucose 4,6-dehydratase [Anaerolineaceae bacterium]